MSVRGTQPADRVVPAPQVAGAPLHIVLVEPQIPPNTGNVARTCAATGCALHLVEPLGFSIDDRALKRAGLDYWRALEVVVHPSLETLLERLPAERCWFVSTRGTVRYDGAPYRTGDALVFGKETAGLGDDLLQRHRERSVRIPMRAGRVRSLNLATTVGIVTYAALGALGYPGLR